jgi:hypothetical protein
VVLGVAGCPVKHVETVHVKEVFRGDTLWDGDVEVFTLSGHHDKVKRCYAWGVPEAKGNGWEITVALEKPPVDSPEMAVSAAIMNEIEKRQLVTCPKEFPLVTLQSKPVDFDFDTPDLGRLKGAGTFSVIGRDGDNSAKISIRWGKGRSQEHYHLSQALVNAIKKESDGRFSLKIP